MRVFLILLLVAFQPCKAQFVEHFDDGDFFNNPVWIGNADNWRINVNGQLQSDNTTENSSFSLSTSSLQSHGQWDFNVQLDFATSGSNYVDVYLMSLEENPISSLNKGYFVRVGNTDDEISLYRKDGASVVKIIDGINGSVGSSSCNVNVRVIRDSSNRFILLRDLNTRGSYFCEGIVFDSTYITSNFFALVVKQSTTSFFRKHYFDDIVVQPFVPDISPPFIEIVNVLSNQELKLIFNEPLDKSSVENVTNYLLENFSINPISAKLDSLNSSAVVLKFTDTFPERVALNLKVMNVKDIWENEIVVNSLIFQFAQPRQFDILINEIMADPSPAVALPEMEWIEIKNNSGFDINLENWKLGLGNSESGKFPFYNFKADSLLIICASINSEIMQSFGNCLGINTFPSLPNEGGVLYLKSPSGKIIHTVAYTDKWYNNPVKKIGGYTLEMLDANNPCSGRTNWTASENIRGGTPGKINSVNRINLDESQPFIKRVYALDSVTVMVHFSETIDSLQASVTSNYLIENINIESANAITPLFNIVKLRLSQPLQRNLIYNISCNYVFDCAGNLVKNSLVKFGLHEAANSDDVVINEVLFNPNPPGVDFVEIYNRGKKLLDLKNIYITNKASDGSLNTPVQLSLEGQSFFPGEFIVLSRDQEVVKREYIATSPEQFIDISMPAFNDDKGSVILLNSSGEILDELNYLEKWHFPLVSNPEGVSLERVHYKGSSDNKEYWTSASKSYGYATPSYKNSQFLSEGGFGGDVSVNPKVISPDNDGIDDFAMIEYKFKEPQMLCTIIIFDDSGRPVRHLQRNVLTGKEGSFRWDGLGERLRKLQSGIYIIYTEAMSLDGKVQKFKNAIVVGYRK